MRRWLGLLLVLVGLLLLLLLLLPWWQQGALVVATAAVAVTPILPVGLAAAATASPSPEEDLTAMAVVVDIWQLMSIPMGEAAQPPGVVAQFAAAVAAAELLPVVAVVVVVVVLLLLYNIRVTGGESIRKHKESMSRESWTHIAGAQGVERRMGRKINKDLPQPYTIWRGPTLGGGRTRVLAPSSGLSKRREGSRSSVFGNRSHMPFPGREEKFQDCRYTVVHGNRPTAAALTFPGSSVSHGSSGPSGSVS